MMVSKTLSEYKSTYIHPSFPSCLPAAHHLSFLFHRIISHCMLPALVPVQGLHVQLLAHSL